MLQCITLVIGALSIALCTGIVHGQEWPEAIADNSFLIEEAYNQEPRVVQHISTMLHHRPAKDWTFSFTQEWPFFSEKHQLSFTLPYSWPDGRSGGPNDALVNYRFQLCQEGTHGVAIAPRFSVILPTGNERREFGLGKVGYQFNFPVSKRLGPGWAVHGNAGLEWFPNVRGPAGRDDLFAYQAGASLIWLWRPNLNLLVEWLSAFEDEWTGTGKRNVATHWINPGARCAVNAGNLQIVPGLAFPIALNGDDPARTIFLYLSFEHPF